LKPLPLPLVLQQRAELLPKYLLCEFFRRRQFLLLSPDLHQLLQLAFEQLELHTHHLREMS
jgi:hypothetical protein